MHQGATPKGGAGAGVYTRDEMADSLISCLWSCCTSSVCHTLFFHNQACYLIQCNSTDACSPIERSDSKFKDSYLITVRSVGQFILFFFYRLLPLSFLLTAPSSPGPSLSDALNNLDVRSQCSPETNEGCMDTEECIFELQESFVGYVCECRKGYEYDALANRCRGMCPLCSTCNSVPSF